MKKKNLWLLASLFVAAFSLSACGDDDDTPASGGETPSVTPPATETDIEGTWKVKLSVSRENYDGGTVTQKLDQTLIFGTDGKFAWESNDEYDGQVSTDRISGTWKKLGSDKVIVNAEKRTNGDEPNPYFKAYTDTLSYFLKGNGLYCEGLQVVTEGYRAYTRDGSLPYKGYNDYANSPLKGVWIGEDFAWDGTPIEVKYEFRTDGYYLMTMDNHLGWGEGFAGYYLVSGNRFMNLPYYFLTNMDDSGEWKPRGFMTDGGYWTNFTIDGDILYADNLMSMGGEMKFLVREGKTAGSSLVGHWKSTQTVWGFDDAQIVEDEYWEIEANNTVRHWWIRGGELYSGTMGTYELGQVSGTDGSVQTYINCHWAYWLVDSGDNTNPAQGESTGRGESDYTLQYIYSAISDAFLVQWPGQSEFERFTRIK